MIPTCFDRPSPEPVRVLCLGCHSDDIEIGCGGTVLRMAAQSPRFAIHWVVFSALGARAHEAARAAELFAGAALCGPPVFKTFPDAFMPSVAGDVKNYFEELSREWRPDVIFTHYKNDAHQDHRLISELTWNTFRNHLILEYEIPKYDGDLGQPNVFMALDEDICTRKVRHIVDTFESQKSKHWFEERTFLSLMRLRGMECNAPSGYAEAFYCRKMSLGISQVDAESKPRK
jgi:LmbE family N-acetylglucosaminyl deacetylase